MQDPRWIVVGQHTGYSAEQDRLRMENSRGKAKFCNFRPSSYIKSSYLRLCIPLDFVQNILKCQRLFLAIFWSSERRDGQVSSEPRTVGTIIIEKASGGALEARAC